MKKVLVRAPLLTNSGYGVHSRQVFSWLLQKSKKENFTIDAECLNWGHCPWIIDRSRESGLIGEIMDRSVKIEPPYDVTFQVQLPDEWNASLGKYNVGITAAVETDICNPSWVENCNQMDQIIVPSKFTKNVIKRSGVLKKPVSVIPEWYHESIDETAENLDLSCVNTSFNLLTVGMLTDQNPEADRKNIINTISSFCQNFKDNKDVGLVVKTSLGKYSHFDRKNTNLYFSNLINSIRTSEFPKVYLLHGNMTKKELAALYSHKKIMGYYTLTRAEGYGLPLIEAAASGLPIIATNYSGHLEFLRKDSFLEVEYQMKELPKDKVDGRIFVQNSKWADPSIESSFTKMNDLYYNYQKYKIISDEYAEYIKMNYSSKAIKKIYEDTFKGVL